MLELDPEEQSYGTSVRSFDSRLYMGTEWAYLMICRPVIVIGIDDFIRFGD